MRAVLLIEQDVGRLEAPVHDWGHAHLVQVPGESDQSLHVRPEQHGVLTERRCQIAGAAT
jgi:hypothetical protein